MESPSAAQAVRMNGSQFPLDSKARLLNWVQMALTHSYLRTLGAKHDIDFIFIQTGPLKVGQVSYSQIVGDGTCWPAFPPHNRVSPECGYADHSPLWAVITL
ncbi:unnamed protein product [Effrenium voratum]|nr:unnamed protein product [Effrenium voratum]